jgi:heat shock protein HspQ
MKEKEWLSNLNANIEKERDNKWINTMIETAEDELEAYASYNNQQFSTMMDEQERDELESYNNQQLIRR